MTAHSVVIAGGGPTGLMLGVRYDLGGGHPLLGRRMPDLDLETASGSCRLFTLLHQARPVLLNLAERGRLDITPWADRVQSVDGRYDAPWELPAIGPVAAPGAVLIRPDGYVAWVGDESQTGLVEALTSWFGSPVPIVEASLCTSTSQNSHQQRSRPSSNTSS